MASSAARLALVEGGRVDQQQRLAVVDCVGRDLGPPVATRGVVIGRPFGVHGLPALQTALQLRHGGI